MLNAFAEFLRCWTADISRYGFMGALTGQAPRTAGKPHGRKAVVLRATAAQRRLTQAKPHPAAGRESNRRDADWGPGAGLRQRREPQL